LYDHPSTILTILPGFAGLVGAKNFLQVHPEAKVVILDDAASVGGTWAPERLYLGLNSNNLLGTFEYPDFPMKPGDFQVRQGQHIPGDVVHDYLSKFTKHFDLEKLIRCKSRVTRASFDDQSGTWSLNMETVDTGKPHTITAKKVIIATGLTSDPFVPYIPGSETFQAPIFHQKQLPQHADALLSSSCSSVTVYGGAKSAYDVVYLFASRGIKVNWVIRSSGMGPAWMMPPYVTPFKMWAEKLVNMRIMTWMSPCIWGDADGYVRIRKWLHGTWLGRKIVDAFWWALANDVCTLNKYDAHPETRKLKPWDL
jgi:cation diffusion facilitator CzcD-associated flavoprotein CzcO